MGYGMRLAEVCLLLGDARTHRQWHLRAKVSDREGKDLTTEKVKKCI